MKVRCQRTEATYKQVSKQTHVVGEAAGECHERRGVGKQDGAAVGCAVVEEAHVVQQQQRRGSSQENGAAAVLRASAIGEAVAQHDVGDVDAQAGGSGARHRDEPQHAATVQRACARQRTRKRCVVRHACGTDGVTLRRAATEAVPHSRARQRLHQRRNQSGAEVALEAQGARDDERASEHNGQPCCNRDAGATWISNRDAQRVAAVVVQVCENHAAGLRVDAASENEGVGMKVSAWWRRSLQLRPTSACSGAQGAQRQQRSGCSDAAHGRRGRGIELSKCCLDRGLVTPASKVYKGSPALCCISQRRRALAPAHAPAPLQPRERGRAPPL